MEADKLHPYMLSAPCFSTVDAGSRPDPYSAGLCAAVPLVPHVAPVPAVHLRHEHDFRQVFRVLVTELHWRVHARGSAMRRLQHFSVEPIRHDRLSVHRAFQVPALVIVVVEGLEIDVMRFWRDTRQLGEIAESATGPRLDRRPPFDAIVVDALRHAR